MTEVETTPLLQSLRTMCHCINQLHFSNCKCLAPIPITPTSGDSKLILQMTLPTSRSLCYRWKCVIQFKYAGGKEKGKNYGISKSTYYFQILLNMMTFRYVVTNIHPRGHFGHISSTHIFPIWFLNSFSSCPLTVDAFQLISF